MPYVQPEVIEQARQMDLLTYLQNFDPDELVRISPNTYSTRTHDSLKISNGKWMWWSRGIGGYNALDYLTKVKGVSFLEAVNTLTGRAVSISVTPNPTPEIAVPKEVELPERCPTSDRITKYLFGRGIDYSIIDFCVRNGLIYESLPHHNVVFVGYDREGKPRYASFRATNDSRIMGDCPGSDKRFSFHFASETSDELHLFECAIDLLSFATLERMSGRNWREHNLLSLSGVYSPKGKIEASTIPLALSHFLTEYGSVSKIHLHLDNDRAGREATKALQTILPDRYEVVDCPPLKGKDYNDDLCIRLGIFKNKSKERGVER